MLRSLLFTPALLSVAYAQCSTLTNSLPAPSLAPGFQAQLAATGLKTPRGIQFDSTGHLLVVDRGNGIYRFSVDNCFLLQDKTLIVNDTTLNHGISVSSDGSTLFASSNDIAYSWAYNAQTGEVSSQKSLVTGMGYAGSGHVTRTLLSSSSQPDLLVVSVGSDENIDEETTSLDYGRSQIRAFNVTEASASSIEFKSGGTVMGWGLRNSVGLGEDGDGQLWSVENSADSVMREGTDVHNDNPGEEFNFHGKLTDASMRGNYGYPNCFAIWNVTALPDNTGLMTGDQFALNESSTLNDTSCAEDYQSPRLTFAAHQAPLDVKFDGDGQAWISFHGSWNREQPIGYKLVTVSMKNYQPTEPNSSTSAAMDVMANVDTSKCPDDCFRPVGLAFNEAGDLFMSSDSTGEIYVIRKADGNGVSTPLSTDVSMTNAPSATPTIFTVTNNGQASTVTSVVGAAATSSKPSAGNKLEMSILSLAAIIGFQALVLFL